MQPNNNLITITPELNVVIYGTHNSIEELYTNPEGLNEQVEMISDIARKAIFDPTTEYGQKEIKHLARNISKAKKILDDEGKKICDILKEKPKKIEASRRKMRQDLEALEAEILSPLTEIENRKAEIKKIQTIHLDVHNSNSNAIRDAIEHLQSIVLDAEYWKESFDDAKAAIKGEYNVLLTILSNAEKREAEAAELERLRKEQEEAQRIIREEQIRKQAEAEAKARMEAEKKMLEQQKAEAEERARIAEEKAKQVTLQPQPKKASNEELKKAIAEMRETILSLTHGDADMAKNIGMAIYKDQIPHVKFELKHQ